MSNPKKHPNPPRVRPRIGSTSSRPRLLDVGQKYVSGQASGDPQNKLQPQAQAVANTRTALVALLGRKSDLQGQLSSAQGAIIVARAGYLGALAAYANAAAQAANGDASVLTSLGVDTAANPSKPETEVITAPVVTVVPGANPGDVKLRCGRVPRAGAYVFEYKLEPSQPADPWLGNTSTKLVSTLVSGLAPAQLIRARARAIGVTASPWSVEVVGRAK